MADNGLVIDRSRITHGESKRAMVLQIEAQRAQRDLDAEKVTTILEEVDRFMMKVIVSVPDGWLPKGITLDDADWLDYVSQERYDEIVKAAQPAGVGEKKA